MLECRLCLALRSPSRRPPGIRVEKLEGQRGRARRARLFYMGVPPEFLDPAVQCPGALEGHMPCIVHGCPPRALCGMGEALSGSPLDHTELFVSCLLPPCHRGSDPSVVRSTSSASDLCARCRVSVRDRRRSVRRLSCRAGRLAPLAWLVELGVGRGAGLLQVQLLGHDRGAGSPRHLGHRAETSAVSSSQTAQQVLRRCAPRSARILRCHLHGQCLPT